MLLVGSLHQGDIQGQPIGLLIPVPPIPRGLFHGHRHTTGLPCGPTRTQQHTTSVRECATGIAESAVCQGSFQGAVPAKQGEEARGGKAEREWRLPLPFLVPKAGLQTIHTSFFVTPQYQAVIGYEKAHSPDDRPEHVPVTSECECVPTHL